MKITLNPNQHYNHSAAEIAEICGILPYWVIQYENSKLTTGLLSYMQQCYGYPAQELTGGSVSSEGVFSFPGDPELYPLLKMQTGDETYYQYPYALLAIVNPKGTFVTRMD